jgi:Gram-negative bacterial TonB protein C-terminal
MLKLMITVTVFSQKKNGIYRTLTCLLMSGVSLLFAQEQPIPELLSPTAIIEEQNKIYEHVELEPQFSNDHRTLIPWISKEIELAHKKKKLPKDTVTVKLLIERDGAIGATIFPEPVNKKLRKETLEIIKRMPNWKAAQQNGRPVRAYAKVEFCW